MFNTRKALIEGFSEILQGQLRQFADDQITSSNWLKTQVLELDQHREGDQDSIEYLLGKVDSLLEDHRQVELTDSDFYGFHSSKDGNQITDLYIDANDKRFVRIYTFLSSDKFDRFIKHLTNNERIDQIWLPQEYMNELTSVGSFKGYGGRFNNKYFLDSTTRRELDENNDYISQSFKSWSNSRKILNLIVNDKDAKQQFALTNARTKIYLGNSDDSVTDDVAFSGKITTLGNSFEPHLDLLDTIVNSYKEIVISKIEEPFAIDYVENSIVGSKIIISLPQRPQNMELFVSRLISGKQPFKLWGVSSKVRDDFASIEAVDMHVMSRLSINVFSNRMEIYFQRGSCGNTILRLLTLMQQNYNSTVSMVDKNGELVGLGMSSE